MSKLIISGLIGVTLVATFQIQANAATTTKVVTCPSFTSPSFTGQQCYQTCYSTSLASQPTCTYTKINTTDVYQSTTGLGSLDCTKKDSGLECPDYRSQLFGTFENPDDAGTTCDPTTLDTDCLINVITVCGPQKCKTDPNQPGCQNMDISASHFSSGQVPAQTVDAGCIKNGNCRQLLEFLGDSNIAVCKTRNFVLINAYADKFNIQDCFCFGGYDSQGQCCADGERVPNQSGQPICKAVGQADCGNFHCNAPRPTAKVGDSYVCCTALSAADCPQ